MINGFLTVKERILLLFEKLREPEKSKFQVVPRRE